VPDRGWGAPARVRGESGADGGGIALTSADVVVVVGDSPVSRRRVRPRAPHKRRRAARQALGIETQCCKGQDLNIGPIQAAPMHALPARYHLRLTTGPGTRRG
jgi:hypothetical protein